MSEPEPDCFTRGGYDEAESAAYVQFSDDSIYRYDRIAPFIWATWLSSNPRGTWFNLVIRQGPYPYHRLPVYPSGLINEF